VRQGEPKLDLDFRDKIPTSGPTIGNDAADRPLNDQSGARPPATAQTTIYAGLEDLIILPLAAVAVAARRIGRDLLLALVQILDWAFPIVLQIVRFPLFTIRIVGDGIAAALKGVVRLLPVSGEAREAWRQRVSEYWARLRQTFSYKAFEQALHHAFENGMAWVFRTCKTLTPGGALLVIAGAVLWLPVSFGIATVLHGVLIAKATVWPAWTQLLHPVATIIAKSKLLVLPAYPAAWPQAKQHALVQGAFRLYEYLAARYLMRKIGLRYQQTERATTDGTRVLRRSAIRIGLRQMYERLLDGLNDLAVQIGKGIRIIARLTIQGLSSLPLIGPIIQRYEKHYNEAAEQESPQKLSERIKGIYDRWSIKLSVDYYEAKDVEVATSQAGQSHFAQSQVGQSQVVQSHVAQNHGAVPSPPATRISSIDPR
jgi:hypothetical protein